MWVLVVARLGRRSTEATGGQSGARDRAGVAGNAPLADVPGAGATETGGARPCRDTAFK